MNAQKFYTLLTIPSCSGEAVVSDLKSLIADYPWFSIAHQLLMEVTLRKEGDLSNEYTAKAAAYAASRNHFYWRLQRPTVEYDEEEDLEFLEERPAVVIQEERQEAPAKPEAQKQEPEAKPKYIMAGGEYFSSDDFSRVAITDNDPLSRFIVTQPKFDPHVSLLNSMDFDSGIKKAESKQRSVTMDYVTETLAQVYLNQQLYDLAIDTYNKLILQIPEKNAYFAAQIKEIKKQK